ncbi:hypothetical protein BDM02DRAFT_3118504 [Thelephora ganbajun]|uniref:Uncharacterized protein n=1 Tax=Thelephora ganbajun TaxID=370292 RepID=A0ACB6ZAD9_THEGA|nr:hypothetical protein BDM02DRAFT_3118504 [Thelephora ganbajun]
MGGFLELVIDFPTSDEDFYSKQAICVIWPTGSTSLVHDDCLHLATFLISKRLNEDGSLIVTDGKSTSGLISHPLPFRSDIKPQSPQALSFISGH